MHYPTSLVQGTLEDDGVSKGVGGGGEGERAEESFKLSNGPLSAAAAPGGPAIPAA